MHLTHHTEYGIAWDNPSSLIDSLFMHLISWIIHGILLALHIRHTSSHVNHIKYYNSSATHIRHDLYLWNLAKLPKYLTATRTAIKLFHLNHSATSMTQNEKVPEAFAPTRICEAHGNWRLPTLRALSSFTSQEMYWSKTNHYLLRNHSCFYGYICSGIECVHSYLLHSSDASGLEWDHPSQIPKKTSGSVHRIGVPPHHP